MCKVPGAFADVFMTHFSIVVLSLQHQNNCELSETKFSLMVLTNEMI